METRLIFVIVFLTAELVAGAVIGLCNLCTAIAELKNLDDNCLVALGNSAA